MPSNKKSMRLSASDPTLLDRRLVSTAEGALPTHARVSVLLGNGWESGLITGSAMCLNNEGKAVIMYRIAYDNGLEKETDLSKVDARLVKAHTADTPRSQRKSAAAPDGAPAVGVTNIPSPSRLADLKVAELRRMCTDLGLESKGTKKELTATLVRAHSTAQALLSGRGLAPVIEQPSFGAATIEEDSREEQVKELEALVVHLRKELNAERNATKAAAAEAALLPELRATVEAREAALAASEATAAELRGALEAQVAEVSGLREQVAALEDREVSLQGELQELKGNVRVLCRLRPPKASAVAPVAQATGMMSSGITRSLTLAGGGAAGGASRTFGFDRVFGADVSNESVFGELRPLARAVADGSRATVLAYGQTGSGKTYTMRSMQHLAVQQLLDRLAHAAQLTGTMAPSIRLSVVEVCASPQPYPHSLTRQPPPRSHLPAASLLAAAQLTSAADPTANGAGAQREALRPSRR